MPDNHYNEAYELVAQFLEKRLRENEREFVGSLAAKLEQYGERTFLSDKQMVWLRAIAQAHYTDPRQIKMF